ncbi:MAG: sulfur carrier protein ThiS [Robiginitomaculum sp.]
MSLTILINGEIHAGIPVGISVGGLLSHLKLPSTKIAVERNQAIVSKSAYETTNIEHGDIFEIIHFIGGG